jgi:hypothetical protein
VRGGGGLSGTLISMVIYYSFFFSYVILLFIDVYICIDVFNCYCGNTIFCFVLYIQNILFQNEMKHQYIFIESVNLIHLFLIHSHF